ncbi:hypothetical protein Tco_0100100, partial [Tanacetum coccineum]
MQIRSTILFRGPLPDVRNAYTIISSEESHRVAASCSNSGTFQSSSFAFSEEQMATLISLTKDNSINGRVVHEYCVSLMVVHKFNRDSKLIVAFDEMNCYVSNKDLRVGGILGTGKQISCQHYFDVNQ